MTMNFDALENCDPSGWKIAEVETGGMIYARFIDMNEKEIKKLTIVIPAKIVLHRKILAKIS